MLKTRDQISVTTFEAAAGLDIKTPRLREWLSRGYIKPAIPTIGRGSKARLDITNLYQLKFFEYLIDQRGFSRKRSAMAVRCLSDVEIFNHWTMEYPLYMSLVEFKGGEQREAVFSSDVVTISLKTENHEVSDYSLVNIGEIVLWVDDRFLL